MHVDRWTGKPVDWPSDMLPSLNGGTCDECGNETIDRCAMCGAPQCCPKCCIDVYIESQEQEVGA